MGSATSTSRVLNPRGQGDQLRGELIEAAGGLLLTSREATPFSLRAVAKSVGVSPAAVYRHFESVADLVDAVLVVQSDALRQALRAGELDDSPLPTLVEMGLRYVHWGLANPGAYQFLFESAERTGHRGGVGTPGWDMIESFAALLAAGLRTDESTADVVAIRSWSALHGVTSLRLHKPTVEWPTTVEEEVAAIAAALFGSAPPRASRGTATSFASVIAGLRCCRVRRHERTGHVARRCSTVRPSAQQHPSGAPILRASRSHSRH